MNFEQRPELRQGLRLTPQLFLNLKLLVLPVIELQQLIEAELEQNPALELADDGDGLDSTAGDSAEEAVLGGKTGDGDSNEEFDIAELLPQDGWDLPGQAPDEGEDEPVISEVTPTMKLTYHDTLLPKLLAEVEPNDTRVAEEIVEWLNEEGFLSVNPAEISEATGIPLDTIKRVLGILRRIPPGGLGCPDVRTALIAQLELKGYSESSLEWRILNDYWNLFMEKKFKQLADKLQVPIEEIEGATVNICALEPKPGRQFNAPAPEYVVPDFSCEWRDGKIVAVEQDSNIPRIRIGRRFIEIIQHPESYPAEAVAFAREKVNNAMMFLKAIESRRRLLCRLMDWVIKRQKEFFQSGPEFLKPAMIKEAAAELGVHQATISRAISGKYVETQFGIFKLRDFFKSGTGGVARSGIKEKIQAMIECEDKNNPLSDEEICSRLAAEGINISRRTVAKYRAELGIPGSDERRR
jgi:RNA polymerase sigma-54 factor|uniref:RNA polymerase sigma-54 factor n=1 Tax=candidate division WOR-3 bacterium TaxID=2052148 RepID=A0A7V3PV13_UNCW3